MAVAGAAVAASMLAGTGAWLIYTSLERASPSGAGGSRPAVGHPARHLAARRGSAGRLRAWLATAGLGEVSPAGLAGSVSVAAMAGGLGAYLLFGGVVAVVLTAAFTGTFPIAGYRRRVRARSEAAVEEWPRVLEEIRLRTGSLGRSIPQALFEAGRAVPPSWRPALDAAEREWLLTVDFARTAGMLKEQLADPTADVVCETLLMAHEIGGTDLDAKLADLIEDRMQDLQSRRDAASRMAGVRFARRFVLLVPIGMAVAGLTIGSGRQAYTTSGGQAAVGVGLLSVALCWWWSGRLMRLPSPPRVFR